jgi:hypothetical protein
MLVLSQERIVCALEESFESGLMSSHSIERLKVSVGQLSSLLLLLCPTL